MVPALRIVDGYPALAEMRILEHPRAATGRARRDILPAGADSMSAAARPGMIGGPARA
jgi:hypothetical protein